MVHTETTGMMPLNDPMEGLLPPQMANLAVLYRN